MSVNLKSSNAKGGSTVCSVATIHAVYKKCAAILLQTQPNYIQNLNIHMRFFSSPQHPDQLWCPPNLLYNGYQGLVPWSKEVGAWCWPLTSIWCHGQGWWSLTSTLPFIFMAWCLIRQRDNSTFTYWIECWSSLTMAYVVFTLFNKYGKLETSGSVRASKFTQSAGECLTSTDYRLFKRINIYMKLTF
jgi:hypothetical protein